MCCVTDREMGPWAPAEALTSTTVAFCSSLSRLTSQSNRLGKHPLSSSQNPSSVSHFSLFVLSFSSLKKNSACMKLLTICFWISGLCFLERQWWWPFYLFYFIGLDLAILFRRRQPILQLGSPKVSNSQQRIFRGIKLTVVPEMSVCLSANYTFKSCSTKLGTLHLSPLRDIRYVDAIMMLLSFLMSLYPPATPYKSVVSF